MFTVRTRCSESLARVGTLRLAHGEVQTPAFVPLATKGALKLLEPRDVEALGYELILGNTFHLLLAPGPEVVAALGGLNEFMRWERPIITDSGGFQVFSMGHGTVADEIKGRRGRAGNGQDGAILAIDESGVRFRSYVDGRERMLGPESSMQVQAALHSDIALAFDECTPFHVTREYTARSTERTHRWLERCLSWHGEHGPADQAVYGIVQGGVEYDLRLGSAAAVAASGCDGIAIGGTLGREKAQMHEVVSWVTRELERLAPERPRHLLGIGEVDDLIAGVEHGIDTFDCAMPTRLGRHGMALVPDPKHRWRVDLTKSAWRASELPILDGCACPACARGFSRAYLHYLLRSGELTGQRLVTLHNLNFIARLLDDLRGGIEATRLEAVAAELRAGGTPGLLGVGAD
ncbi:MAG: tRNA guanosine(34) transglycosylase Tgt [Solirubrobacterales bacterium]|nr:tRNA guanosine(34) transglycosylase Tgt [Solirubrobacterales bacterium]MBV9916924.1 tRNA guanosine(34) transglycosylase Tgt [Solirubrobacterales bacterium]